MVSAVTSKQELKLEKRRDRQKRIDQRRKDNADRPGLFGLIWQLVITGLKTVFGPAFLLMWLVKRGLYLVIAVGAVILILVLSKVLRWLWPMTANAIAPAYQDVEQVFRPKIHQAEVTTSPLDETSEP